MTDSDASLVVRVVADDDRSAFEMLVRRHQSKLRNFLRRLTGNDAARADDLAQETFLKAYRSIRTYRGTAAFSSWLYRIAYNTFLNDERSRLYVYSTAIKIRFQRVMPMKCKSRSKNCFARSRVLFRRYSSLGVSKDQKRDVDEDDEKKER